MIISKTVYRERKQTVNLLALKILDSFFFQMKVRIDLEVY